MNAVDTTIARLVERNIRETQIIANASKTDQNGTHQ